MNLLPNNPRSRAVYLSLLIHVIVLLFVILQIDSAGGEREVAPVETRRPTEEINMKVTNQQRIDEAFQNITKAHEEVTKQQQQELAKIKKNISDQNALIKKKKMLFQDSQNKLEGMRKEIADATNNFNNLEKKRTESQKKISLESKQLAAIQLKKKQASADLAKKAAEESERQKKLASEEARLLSIYSRNIKNQIEKNWNLPVNVQYSKMPIIRVKLGQGGVIQEAKIIQSSMNPTLDNLALLAVKKSSPLPVPQDHQLFQSLQVLQIKLNPDWRNEKVRP